MTGISYVQNVGYTAPAATASVVITVASGVTTTQGNQVIVRPASTGGNAVSGITDTHNNPYTKAIGPSASGSTAEIWIGQLNAALVAGDTITVTYPASKSATTASADEFSGIATTSPVDKTADAVTSSGKSVTVGPTAATTQADELVVTNASGSANGTWTYPGSPWTAFTNPGGNIRSQGAYQLVSSTGTFSATWNDASASNIEAVIATFKAAAPPAPPIANSFEGGTDGTAISTTNSGGSSGTAFDSLGGSTTLPVFSAAGAIHGSMGASTPLSGNSTTTIEWKQAFSGFNASSVPWYARDYFMVTSLPPVQAFLMKAQDDNAPQDVWAVYLDTSGHLGIRNRVAGTNLASSVGAVALNTPTRWETECVYDGATYTITLECYFGSNVEGSTPDETLGPVTVSSADVVDLVAFGAQTATVQTWSTVYHDDIGLSATGWLGPTGGGRTPTLVPSLLPAFLC